jgi:hypothetical protein
LVIDAKHKRMIYVFETIAKFNLCAISHVEICRKSGKRAFKFYASSYNGYNEIKVISEKYDGQQNCPICCVI